MTNADYVGHNRNPGDTGAGWSGVTPEQKDRAAGRDQSYPQTARVRLTRAVANTRRVASLHGSGYWSGLRGMR